MFRAYLVYRSLSVHVISSIVLVYILTCIQLYVSHAHKGITNNITMCCWISDHVYSISDKCIQVDFRGWLIYQLVFTKEQFYLFGCSITHLRLITNADCRAMCRWLAQPSFCSEPLTKHCASKPFCACSEWVRSSAWVVL